MAISLYNSFYILSVFAVIRTTSVSCEKYFLLLVLDNTKVRSVAIRLCNCGIMLITKTCLSACKKFLKVATHVTACCACKLRTWHQCSMHLFSSTTRLKLVHSIQFEFEVKASRTIQVGTMVYQQEASTVDQILLQRPFFFQALGS